MKKFLILPITILFSLTLFAIQASFASDSLFPTGNEFAELRMLSEKRFEDPRLLDTIADGRLMADVGWDAYESRSYASGAAGSLTLEIVKLRDTRAAFSLLSFLRPSATVDGPPGDSYAHADRRLVFAQNRYFVRLVWSGVQEDVVHAISAYVSRRIGDRRQWAPSLVSHFPASGYNASSLRYSPGLAAYRTSQRDRIPDYVRSDMDMEIARADYALEGFRGTLTLLNFPTPQIAEGYFEELDVPAAERPGGRLYARRAGPLIAFLEGDFPPTAARQILDGVRFSYSVRWVYDKNASDTVLWGIPVPILGTIVNSLIFVMVLCVASVLVGAAVALLRFAFLNRKAAARSDSEDSSDFIRLRLQ